MKKKYIIIVVLLVVVAMAGGFFLNSKMEAGANESRFLSQLRTQPQELQDAYAKGGLAEYNKALDFYLVKQAFVTQYGNDVTIQQMVIPERVYASAWTTKDGVKHISWNIGGLWVEVWNSKGINTEK